MAWQNLQPSDQQWGCSKETSGDDTHPGFVLCLLPYPLHHFVNFPTGCVRPRLVAELSLNQGLDGTCPEDSHYNLLIAGWNDSMSGTFFKMLRPRLSYHSFRSQPCHLSLPTDFSKVKSGQAPGHQPSIISTIPLTLHLLNVSSINDMFSLFTRQLCSSSENWECPLSETLSSRCPWHITALICFPFSLTMSSRLRWSFLFSPPTLHHGGFLRVCVPTWLFPVILYLSDEYHVVSLPLCCWFGSH